MFLCERAPRANNNEATHVKPLANLSPHCSDIYRPTERGTATGWFLSGTLIGPAFGPFIGGLIVTYTSWRVIFWLQTGLASLATIGIYFLMPETIFHKKIDDLAGYSGREKGRALVSLLDPWKVLKLLEYPSTYHPLLGNTFI